MAEVDAVARELQQYKAILENATIAIAYARNRVVEHSNRAFDRLFGWPAGALAGQSIFVLYRASEIDGQLPAQIAARLSQGLPVEFDGIALRHDGSEFFARFSGMPIDPKAPLAAGTVWTVQDTSELDLTLKALQRSQTTLEQRVAERTAQLAASNERLSAQVAERELMEAQIRALAEQDSLTGLLNRGALETRLDSHIEVAASANHKVGVLFLDLDRFKAINDSLGHEAGDALLRLVARRLRALTRSSDVLSRFGGDEFVLVLPSIEDPAMLDGMAARLVEELSRPYPLAGKLLHVTPSIGGAIFPEHGQDRKTLLARADAAMYHAKSIGRRCYAIFSPKVQQVSGHRLRLQNDLHQALAGNELFLEYQARVDCQSGQIRGCEALVRWHHPTLGLIGPGEFIPIAEEIGLMENIGEWILRQACLQRVQWLEQGIADVSLAVNLSVQQLSRPGLQQKFQRILHETSLPAHLLEIEITESMLLLGCAEVVDSLQALHELGVQISIDDFGVGYSSLVYLKRFPIDALKIDQSFVRDITSDPEDAIIVKTIVGLARSLNKRVIAEGVETPAQLAFLREAGCDEYQGFLFSEAVGPEKFLALLRQPAATAAVSTGSPQSCASQLAQIVET